MRSVSLAACAAIATLPLVGRADGPLFQPSSATATSEFSGQFGIIHAINGSGLPANFTPLSPHADYSTNNHWTTKLNQTVGQSATFFFSTPQTVGGFYLWQHRSNVIANNPNYAVVRFDLEFFDAGGGLLASLPNLAAEKGIAIAQVYGFPVVFNVSRVRFTVRETFNNNVSPYTGLAEVAFTSCVAPRPAPVANTGVCPGGTVSFTATVNGTGPFTYQWRRNGEPIDTLLNPSAATATLTITNVSGEDVASYDCFIDGPCEPATTAPATLALCPADLDCNTLVDDEDFQIFVVAYNILDCADPSMPAGCPSDLNADAIVDDLDFQVFVLAYNALVCE
ncbi:MAG TPA: immunoglobulin domain-containing protein [Phycisphaerales bacterium]